jgi:hypothetical protein
MLLVEEGPWYARHLCIRDLHAEHVAVVSGDSSIAPDDPVIRFPGCAGCNTLETLQRPPSLPLIYFDCRISCPDPYICIISCDPVISTWAMPLTQRSRGRLVSLWQRPAIYRLMLTPQLSARAGTDER